MSRGLDRLRAEFQQYNKDVKQRGKPFYPFAMFHDTVMSLIVVVVIVAMACIWKFTSDEGMTPEEASSSGSLGRLYDDKADPGSLPEGKSFPTALDPFTCTRYEIAEFTRAAADLGVRYLGVCCGAAPHHIRSMAEALGCTPEGSRYSADMSKHAYFGTDPTLRQENREYAEEL